MAKLLKDGSIVADTWTRCDATAEDFDIGKIAGANDNIVMLPVWLKHSENLRTLPRLGLLLAGSDDLAQLAADLPHIDLIAIEFPKFADGRGFSSARLLRERFGFKGEIRAVGTYLPDQIYYLRRCGFDAFEVSDDRADDALGCWTPFSEPYQGAVDQAPLYQRRAARDFA
jgi:uncharacterized protein (DUF934 family)